MMVRQLFEQEKTARLFGLSSQRQRRLLNYLRKQMKSFLKQSHPRLMHFTQGHLYFGGVDLGEQSARLRV